MQDNKWSKHRAWLFALWTFKQINIQALNYYFKIHVDFIKRTLWNINLSLRSDEVVDEYLYSSAFLYFWWKVLKGWFLLLGMTFLKTSLLSQFGRLPLSGCRRRDCCCVYVCLFASVAGAEVLLFRWWDLAGAQCTAPGNTIRTSCQLYFRQ